MFRKVRVSSETAQRATKTCSLSVNGGRESGVLVALLQPDGVRNSRNPLVGLESRLPWNADRHQTALRDPSICRSGCRHPFFIRQFTHHPSRCRTLISDNILSILSLLNQITHLQLDVGNQLSFGCNFPGWILEQLPTFRGLVRPPRSRLELRPSFGRWPAFTGHA